MAMAAAGCTPPETSEFLRITYGSGEFAPPVEADTFCNNGGCDGFEQLEAQLTYDGSDVGSSESNVEILQYRVDYDLDGADDDEQPPFYANETVVLCPIGQTVSFNVLTVGEAQRTFVRAHFGTGQIDGTAFLTLEGYDDRNAIVSIGAPFAIAFSDFVDDDDVTP